MSAFRSSKNIHNFIRYYLDQYANQHKGISLPYSSSSNSSKGGLNVFIESALPLPLPLSLLPWEGVFLVLDCPDLAVGFVGLGWGLTVPDDVDPGLAVPDSVGSVVVALDELELDSEFAEPEGVGLDDVTLDVAVVSAPLLDIVWLDDVWEGKVY